MVSDECEVVGMKYYCGECDCEFEEPKDAYEFHSELAGMGGDCAERFEVCPECGSDDIYEMEKCDLCGEEYRKTIYLGGKELCQECRDKIVYKLTELMEEVQGMFDLQYDEAQELIIEVADDIWN